MELTRYFYLPSKAHPSRQAAMLDGVLRRALDITVSFWGLFFLFPFLLVIAWRVRRNSPGPIFYRGLRVGRGGREFYIVKFRTMYERPDSYSGARVTGAKDARITPLGRWLRETKINELPQLWNVLKGEMSLVGPRPEDPQLVATWPEEMRREVLAVRPGLTSPASIMFRDEENLLQSTDPLDDYLRHLLPSKLRMDVLYVRRRTILNDLDIIFLTLIALLPRLRNVPIADHMLYNGPVNRFVNRFLGRLLVDWLISLMAVAFAGVIWRLSGPLEFGTLGSIVVALLVALIFSLANAAFGLNRIVWRKAPAGSVLGLFLTSALATLVILALNQIPGRFPHLPVGMVFLMAGACFSGFVIVRYRERVITAIASRWLALRHQAQTVGERTLIFGAGEMGGLASWLMHRQDFSRAFSVVGFIDDDLQKIGTVVDGAPVLGTTSDLAEIIKKYGVSLVLLAVSDLPAEQHERVVEVCQQASARLILFPNIVESVRSSLLAQRGTLPDAWVQRSEVNQVLDEVRALLDQGDLEKARLRMDEFQRKYRTTEGKST